MHMNKTKKILTIAISMTLLSFMIAGFLYGSIVSKSNEVVALLTEAEKDITKDQTLRIAQTVLDRNTDLLQELDTYSVAPDGVVPFIDEIESLETISGGSVSIVSVSSDADPKNKNDFKETLKIRLEATGSWNNVTHTLALLESLPYEMNIQEATIGLVSASDKLLFASSTRSTRIPGEGEYWKGTFDISVTKLK